MHTSNAVESLTCQTRRYLVTLGLAIQVFVLPSPSHSEEIELQLVATGSGRAILIVNGERMVLNDSQPGTGIVKLISADSEQVELEINGEIRILRTD